MKRFCALLMAGMTMLALAGCQGDGNTVTEANRNDQVKAFNGDPSKAPDSVKRMMQQGGNPGSQPAAPTQR